MCPQLVSPMCAVSRLIKAEDPDSNYRIYRTLCCEESPRSQESEGSREMLIIVLDTTVRFRAMMQAKEVVDLQP